MVDWPEGIPFFNLRSGYGAQPGENTLRTPMDVGPAKVRRRTTAAPSVITGSAYMTREQAQRFEQFWRDTLLDGTLSFTLEDGLYRRRNLLVQSEDFSAGWAAGTGLTRIDAASIIPGATASRYDNDGTTTNRSISQVVGSISGQPETLTAVLENVSATNTRIGNYDNTSATFFPSATINWSTVTATLSSGDGSFSLANLGTGPNGGQLVRFSVTGSGTGGNVRRPLIYMTGVAVNSDATIIHWAQLETGLAFTQYEPVGASYPTTHVTRGGLKTYRIVGVPRFDLMGLGHGVPVTLEVLP